MLKKSKVVALLVACLMMFAVVEPVLARTWGQVAEDTAYGAVVGGASGGFWGGVLSAIGVGVVVVMSGGTALPAILAIGGAAATGAAVGGGTGAVLGAGVGACTDKKTVDDCLDGITKVAEAVALGVVGAKAGAGAGAAALAPAR